MKKEAKT